MNGTPSLWEKKAYWKITQRLAGLSISEKEPKTIVARKDVVLLLKQIIPFTNASICPCVVK